MRGQVDLLSILLRHISWFLILLAGMMADISSTVSFPSDEALKVDHRNFLIFGLERFNANHFRMGTTLGQDCYQSAHLK